MCSSDLYLSNMLTLPVGTVIALGTPPGSHGGLGRHLVPGDINVCSYQGLGTLTNPMVAEGASRTSSSALIEPTARSRVSRGVA